MGVSNGQLETVVEGNYNYVVYTNGSPRLFVKGDGNVGIGTTGPDRLLHPEASDAVTAAVTYVQRLSHVTSGTAAAGFGVGMEMELEDGSGTNRVASYLETLWDDPATATYKGRLVLKAVDSGGTREVIRIEGSGTAGELGFFAAAAVAQQIGCAIPTDLPSCIAAITALRTALNNYGLTTVV
jgi:hypothetical protein